MPRKTSYMVLTGRYDVAKILIFFTQTSGCSSNLYALIVARENAENYLGIPPVQMDCIQAKIFQLTFPVVKVNILRQEIKEDHYSLCFK